MNKFLLSICALAVVASPVWAEDQDQPKQKSKSQTQTAPQRPVAPRTVTPRTAPQPRVQQNVPANTQLQNRNKYVTPRTYAPKTVNPNTQTRTRTFTPPDQDAAQPNVPSSRSVTPANTEWQNRHRSRYNSNTLPQVNTTTQSHGTTPSSNTVQNRDWRNRDRTNTTNTTNTTNRNWQNSNNRNWQNTNTNRNWQNHNRSNVWTYDQARRYHNRSHHNRSWWRSHYSHIALFAGGYYYWNSGYWYPAYGYDPYYSTYTYDEPIYGYNNLEPGQVIVNVQNALQEQGYYRDQVDGLIGPNTRAALRAFQQDQRLPVTGAIDGPTLQALGLD